MYNVKENLEQVNQLIDDLNTSKDSDRGMIFCAGLYHFLIENTKAIKIIQTEISVYKTMSSSVKPNSFNYIRLEKKIDHCESVWIDFVSLTMDMIKLHERHCKDQSCLPVPSERINPLRTAIISTHSYHVSGLFQRFYRWFVVSILKIYSKFYIEKLVTWVHSQLF